MFTTGGAAIDAEAAGRPAAVAAIATFLAVDAARGSAVAAHGVASAACLVDDIIAAADKADAAAWAAIAACLVADAVATAIAVSRAPSFYYPGLPPV